MPWERTSLRGSRLNADKRRAVELLVRDPEWGQWSDREIARQCAVGQVFVSELRASLSTVDSDNGDRTYRTNTARLRRWTPTRGRRRTGEKDSETRGEQRDAPGAR